jgi:hypothetical protein
MEISLSVEKFMDLRYLLQAFTSMRDIQVAGMVLQWALKGGFAAEEVIQFAQMAPKFQMLEKIGYFAGVVLHPGYEKQIKELEKTLPKDMRIKLRRKRLKTLAYGNIHNPSGG